MAKLGVTATLIVVQIYNTSILEIIEYLYSAEYLYYACNIKKMNNLNNCIKKMSLTLVLFLIGILGFVFNRKNIILMLISIEIMLLSITFLILVSSINLDDIIGQTYAVYIIVVAGAESAIGLAILVAFYRLRGSIAIEYK